MSREGVKPGDCLRSPAPFRRLGTGEPVLLLHGFSLSWHSWARTIDALAADHDVLALTLGGHWGGPEILRENASAAHLADLVERAMDEQGWATAHIVGNSLGGWLAMELALRGRARSVVGIAPGGGWPTDSPDLARLSTFFVAMYPAAKSGYLLSLNVAPYGLRRRALSVMCRHPDRVPADTARMLLGAPARCRPYLTLIRNGIRNGPLGDLGAIKVPVTIVECEHDSVVRRRMLDRFLTEIDGSVLVELSDVGHIPMPEAPELVAGVIRDHIASALRTTNKPGRRTRKR